MKKFMVFFVVFINFLLIPTVTFAAPVWPTFQYNFQRTGENPYDTSQNKGTVKWMYRVLGSGTLAIGSDGTIYVGTSDYYLYAFNPDGTVKWQYDLGGPVNLDGPTIGNDGTIYINGYYGYDRGCLNAINPDGTLKWQYPLGYDPNIVPAIGSDGTIYTAYTDNYYFGLVAVNPDGTLKWQFKTGSSSTTDFRIVSSISIDSNGTIYFVTGNGTLYAVNSNGVLKWSFYLNYYVNSLPASTPTIGKDGTIYVGSDDNNLYAINPDGTVKWKFLTGGYVRSTPTIGNDGTIYVGDEDKYLYAINPNGTLKWKYLTDYPGSSTSTVTVDSNGIIYYAPAAWLYALNSDGTLRWLYKTPGGYFSTSVVIGSDGTLYGVANYGQYLYAWGNPSYNVNFVVKDPKGNAISNATISINGSTLTTDSNGQSTIQLPNDSYGYTVSSSGYQNTTGNITVNGSNLTINVTLYPQTYNLIDNVSLDSSNNTYAAGQAVKINVTTTGSVYRVTAQMWYNSNDLGNTGITDLVSDGNGSWHTRQSSFEGYDTVVIIPINTPDGTYNITITAYARYPDGTEDTKSITIPITVKGTIYDYYHSEINN